MRASENSLLFEELLGALHVVELDVARLQLSLMSVLLLGTFCFFTKRTIHFSLKLKQIGSF